VCGTFFIGIQKPLRRLRRLLLRRAARLRDRCLLSRWLTRPSLVGTAFAAASVEVSPAAVCFLCARGNGGCRHGCGRGARGSGRRFAPVEVSSVEIPSIEFASIEIASIIVPSIVVRARKSAGDAIIEIASGCDCTRYVGLSRFPLNRATEVARRLGITTVPIMAPHVRGRSATMPRRAVAIDHHGSRIVVRPHVDNSDLPARPDEVAEEEAGT
jgi:hypothetical protein